MPEIVEVRLSAEFIKPIMQGRIIIIAEPSHTGRYNRESPEGYRHFCEELKAGNMLINNVETKGKFLYWSLSNSWWIGFTFGMTGQFSIRRECENNHPCFFFHHISPHAQPVERQQLVFNDPRHFGTIRFSNDPQELTNKLNNLGWDALQYPHADKTQLSNKIRKSTKTIAQLLMDQSLFAGVGNYIKSECLYQAKISPWRLGTNLNQSEIDAIYSSIVDVIQNSYRQQGASISTYKSVDGKRGNFVDFFKVYRKKLDPLNNPVLTQTTPDKRTSHWAPAIQK